MPNNIQADAEVIISSALNGIGGNPYIGISLNLPTILPVNLIPRIPGVQPPVFVIKRVEGDIYTLTINGMQVIELEGRVFAAVEHAPQEWVIKYRELQDAYTITKRLPIPEEIGWIAPIDGENAQIRVGPLNTTPTAPPGQYPLEELYKFQFPSL
ncbi:hypothetical protein BKA82DRAFT_994197 [Pisolithus tinctorius]|uniref:Uncharacterized protein n=1 Tax=Pisolithus tinctorius Marx 270 TaxID=870435 RepID=A0A0C3PSX2_PISTI|nr:hypothetical protein BKA82DRAFT_994197 [Pisolithus tinctorius]KIO12281.1 hypothetical protein M404DRAFT_994197 [Pisolithus tinctorius Marx 270]